MLLASQDVGQLICQRLGSPGGDNTGPCSKVAPTLPLGPAALPLGVESRRLGDWKVIADRVDTCREEVTIAIVGKYTGIPDAYVSVIKALQHAALEAGLKLSVACSGVEANRQKQEP